MIKTKTVFILGAGASCPYGFPLGKDLCQEIGQRYSADLFNYLSRRARTKDSPLIAQEVSRAKVFAKTLCDSQITSIDKFLALNSEYMESGIRGIIFRIIQAERGSRFQEPTEYEGQDWYKWLYNKLIDELKTKDDYCRFQENDISFITFNYDRSLERSLHDSFSNSFKAIDPEKLLEQINQIRIIHVFGRIAPLKWQDSTNGVEYGPDVNDVKLDALTQNLRIIYEKEKNPNVEEAQKLISEAKRIFFLGFGYAKENLDVLSLNSEQLVYGTSVGLTERETNDVRVALHKTFRSKGGAANINIEGLDCLGLLRKHL